MIPSEMNCDDNPRLTVTLIYPPATVTDDSGDEVVITDYPASGNDVYICTGQLRRLITITATDSSDNSASCTFYVCKYGVNVFLINGTIYSKLYLIHKLLQYFISKLRNWFTACSSLPLF